MGTALDFGFMIAVPTIFVGIPAVLFVLSEKCKVFRAIIDWFLDYTALNDD